MIDLEDESIDAEVLNSMAVRAAAALLGCSLAWAWLIRWRRAWGWLWGWA